MEMEMEMELDFDFGFIGAPSNSIFVSETKMEMELDFQWTGGFLWKTNERPRYRKRQIIAQKPKPKYSLKKSLTTSAMR